MANRLEFILSAKSEGLEKALKDVDTAARKAGKGVSDSFVNASDGVSKLVDAAESAEFQGIVDKAKDAAKGIKGTFDKTGTDLEKSFASAKDSGLSKSFTAAKAAAASFAKGARTDLKVVEKATQETEEAVRDLDGAFDLINLDSLTQGASDLAGGLASIGAGASAAGDQLRLVDQQLKKTFTNPADVQKYAAIVRRLKGEFEGLDAAEVVEGIQNLNKFGVATEKNLNRVAAIAQATGKSIGDISDPFGEFFASASKGQDLGAFEELRVLLGVGASELRKFGAEVDSQNQVLGDTPAQVKAANSALQRYIDGQKQFSDVSKRSQDSVATLKAEIQEFTDGVGAGTSKFQQSVAQGLTPYIEKLNEFSDETKATAGIATVAAGGVATFGAKALEVGAFGLLAANQLKTLTGATKAGAVAAAGSAASFAAMAAGGVIAVAGVALIVNEFRKMRNAIKDAEDAQNSLLDTQRKFLAGNKDAAQSVNKSIDAIRSETGAMKDANQQRTAITEAILAREAAASLELQGGNSKRAAALQAEANALKRTRSEYDNNSATIVKSENAAKQAIEDRFEAARVAFNTFKKDASEGLFPDNKAALKRLDEISRGLSGPVLKEAQAERRKILESILTTELDNLKKGVEQNKISAADAVKIQEQLLKEYESKGDARKAIEKDQTAFFKAEAEKRLAIAEQFAAKELDLRRSQLDLDKADATDSADAAISATQAKIAAEENAFAQLREQIAERAVLLKSYVDEEAAIERITIQRQRDADVRAAKANNDMGSVAKIRQQAATAENQVLQQAAAQKRQIDRETTEATKAAAADETKFKANEAAKQRDIDKQSADLRKAQAEEEQAALEANFADRRRLLEEQAALGQDRASELAQLAKEETAAKAAGIKSNLKLEEERIALELEAANVGASKAQQTLNAEKAALELAKARRQAQSDSQAIVDSDLQTLKDQTTELIKQKKLLEDQNTERKKGATFQGGAQSVEDAFNSNLSGLGVSRRANKDGETPEDIQKKIDRNLGIINSKENAGKTPSAPTNGFGVSRKDAAAAAAEAAKPQVDAGTAQVITLLTALIAETKAQTGALKSKANKPDRKPSDDGKTFARRFDRTDGIA